MNILQKAEWLNDFHVKYSSQMDSNFIGHVLRPAIKAQKVEPKYISDIEKMYLKMKRKYPEAQKYINQKDFYGVYIKSDFEYKMSGDFNQYCYTSNLEEIKAKITSKDVIDIKELLLMEIENNSFCKTFLKNFCNGKEILKQLGKDDETMQLLNNATRRDWEMVASCEEASNEKVYIQEQIRKTNVF